NWDEAEERIQAILARPDQTDFAARSASSYLADCAFGRGDGERALERYLDAFEEVLGAGDINNALIQLEGVAASLSLLGREATAACMVGAIRRTERDIGLATDVVGIDPVSRNLDALPDRLGREEYERQLAAGGELSFEELVNRARLLVPIAR
ncbi:MAG: hypothetical protein ACRDPA_33080, partial [Solirubrobacteraceae bacterium]